MPENIKIHFELPSVDDKIYGNKKMGRPRSREPVNLQSIIRDIKSRNMAPEVEVELIKRATSWPHGALPVFKRNMGRHIINVQQGLKTKQ